MIELKQVYYQESELFNEAEIHFNYNNIDGIYTILEYKEKNEVSHFISYKLKTHIASRFHSRTEIFDTDFIKAFNQYFNYQLPN